MKAGCLTDVILSKRITQAVHPRTSFWGVQVPSGETEKAAVEALKAEVRCIGRTHAPDENYSTTMDRLKAELNRLQVALLFYFPCTKDTAIARLSNKDQARAAMR